MKNFLFLMIMIGITMVSCENYVMSRVVPIPDNDTVNNPDESSNNNNDDDISVIDEFNEPDPDNDDEFADESETLDDSEEDDSSSFVPFAICGNNKVEGKEVCDGNTIECEELGFISGFAFCKPDCSGWNDSACLKECEDDSVRCDGSKVFKCVSGKYQEETDCSLNSNICRGGRCIDPNEIDPRLDFQNPFTGNNILIYNYSTVNTLKSSGTLSTIIPMNQVSEPYDIPKGMLRRDLRPPVPEHLEIPQIIKNPQEVLYRKPLSFTVGSKDTFYIYDFGSGGNRAVTTTLRNRGTYCEVWVEDDSSINDSTIQSIVNEFDSVIYPLVTSNFYAVGDIDGNGVVSIFLGNLGGYAAGYVSPSDFYTKEEYPESNFRDLIYIQVSGNTSSMNSTIVHEFQHLVHANRNVLVEGDYNSWGLHYRYIDEGLAMAAQHMYEGTQKDMLYVINNSQFNGPIRDGNSFLYWDYDDHSKVYSDYAMAYVFFQYLRIHSGNKTSIYREIIECTTNDHRCVENIVKKYVDPYYSLSDFIVDFRITLILQDKSGPYSFGNEKDFTFSIPPFAGSQVNLRGGGGVYINSPGTFTRPSNAHKDIIFVGINK